MASRATSRRPRAAAQCAPPRAGLVGRALYSILFLARVGDLLPGLVRIERCHAERGAAGGAAEILLVDGAVVAHDERHDTRVAVLGRIGHEREPADQLAAHRVVERTAGRVRALPGED